MPFTKTHLPAHNPIIAPGIVIFKKIAPAVKFFGMYCAHISRMCLSNVFQPQAHVLPHYFDRDSVPKICPIPRSQPSLNICHLNHHCNPKKQSKIWRVPKCGPAPLTEVDIYGSFVTSLCVTWQGYVILGHCVP